jgi:putative ABC transport system ATP-binding protein
MITLKNIHKSFFQGGVQTDVLKGIDLFVKSGESLALLGKSGSGKSTLLALIGGLELPDQGELSIDNVSLAQLKEDQLTRFRAEKIGIIFQQFHLISTLSALENVLLPLEILKRPKSNQTAMELLHNVGLAHRINHLPSQLSGGEAQRVALARALASAPQILLADEPSGNLDEETGQQVMDLMFKLTKDFKTTLVLVTHDLALAQRCERLVQLERGVIKCS